MRTIGLRQLALFVTMSFLCPVAQCSASFRATRIGVSNGGTGVTIASEASYPTAASVGRYLMGQRSAEEHMLSTYFCLRLGMTLLALCSPFVIVGWAMYWGAHWEDSLSAYYFSPGDGKVWNYSNYPGRVPFVGILFALGFSLWAYKGFTKEENVLLNLAGICALLVATFPMHVEEHYISISKTVHFLSAAALFFCMAVVAIFCSKSSLREIADEKVRARYARAYRLIGCAMFCFPLIGFFFAYVVGAEKHYLLFIEAAGVWTFAAFWGLKTFELRSMDVDRKAIKGELAAQR